MPTVRFEIDDIERLMGADEMTKSQARARQLPEGYKKYFVARAPKLTYYFGMLINSDCHLIDTVKEFNGW
jgi:hypothetical protein